MITDRIVEYPNRYKLVDENGGELGPYTLVRDEGTVTQQGTPLNASNLNPSLVSQMGSYTIDANGDSSIMVRVNVPSGKTLAGVIGVNITGTNSAYARIEGFYVRGNYIYANIHNDNNASVTWDITVYGICI